MSKSKLNIGHAANTTITKMKHQDIASKSETDTNKNPYHSFFQPLKNYLKKHY